MYVSTSLKLKIKRNATGAYSYANVDPVCRVSEQMYSQLNVAFFSYFSMTNICKVTEKLLCVKIFSFGEEFLHMTRSKHSL